MSRTHRRAALEPTILGELLSQCSSPPNPVFAGSPAGISKDAVRLRALLTQPVCADILLTPFLNPMWFPRSQFLLNMTRTVEQVRQRDNPRWKGSSPAQQSGRVTQL